MKPVFPLLLAGAITLGAAAQAQARQERAEAPRPRMARMQERVKDRLNLTEEQEKKISALHLEHQKKLVQIQSAIRLARLDIRGLWMNDKPDRTAIEKKTKEISDLQHQEKLSMIDQHFAMMGVLTPGQQNIWKENHRVRMFRRGMDGHPGMRQPRMRGEGGPGPWGFFDQEGVDRADMAEFADPVPLEDLELPETPPLPQER